VAGVRVLRAEAVVPGAAAVAAARPGVGPAGEVAVAQAGPVEEAADLLVVPRGPQARRLEEESA
jgi:hypothetical protein